MFWVSEQRLVDQVNTIRRNSWMTELEIEQLERKVTRSDSVIVEEEEEEKRRLQNKVACGREGCKIRLKSLVRT